MFDSDWEQSTDAISRRICTLTPAERDELLQLYLAQSMSDEQRFRAVGDLIEFALQCQRANERRDG